MKKDQQKQDDYGGHDQQRTDIHKYLAQGERKQRSNMTDGVA